jgi:hypothetical protein
VGILGVMWVEWVLINVPSIVGRLGVGQIDLIGVNGCYGYRVLSVGGLVTIGTE